MARESYIFHPETGELVPKHLYRRPPVARSDLPMPMIRSDAIQPGRSQLDGRTYDSLSALKASYREYEARTGKQVEIVGDQVHHLTRETSESADDCAIDAAIKTSLEMHGA
jgi:hypothetical protein